MGIDKIEINSINSNNGTNNKLTNIIKNISDNIFFIQERIGKDGKTFDVYKIRTMQKDAESNIPNDVLNGNKQVGDSRILESRKGMRKMGFDEIPQIINILKGEMNFFCSRPMDLKTYEQLNNSQKDRRDKDKPGIFGGYAFFDKGKRAEGRTIRENQDVYMKLKRINEKKGKLNMIKFNTYIFTENVKAIIKGVNR